MLTYAHYKDVFYRKYEPKNKQRQEATQDELPFSVFGAMALAGSSLPAPLQPAPILAPLHSAVLKATYAFGNETVDQLALRLATAPDQLRGLNSWPAGPYMPVAGRRLLYAGEQEVPEENLLLPQQAHFRAIGGKPNEYQMVVDALTCHGVPEKSLSRLNLTRIGGPGDGGYLISDLVLRRSIHAAQAKSKKPLVYSFGISDEYSFENALATKYGCETHGYDPSVAEDPAHRFHFHKLGLSNRPGELRGVGPVVDFATIVRDTGGTGRRVAIWKSDIEGSEFPALLAMSDEELDQIDQIAIEWHWLGGESPEELSIGYRGPDEVLRVNMTESAKVIQRLNQRFAVVHTHVNNFSPMQEVKGTASSPPVQFPTAWEVTYVNKWALDGLDLDVGVPANGVTTNVESEQARSDHFHRDIQCVCLPAGKSYGGRRATCGYNAAIVDQPRRECGPRGISQAECEGLGCVFNELHDNATDGLPWCFKKPSP